MPYVKWSLLFLILHNIFYRLNIYNGEYGFNGSVSHPYSMAEYVERCFRILFGLHGHEQLLGGYWFIPQLLYASIIGFLTIKYVKNLYLGMGIMLGLAFMTSIFDLRVPFWSIRSLTFLSTSFFLAGYLYKKKYTWDKWYMSVAFAIVVAIASVYCFTTMLSFKAIEILPYFFCGVLGTVMVLNLGKYISSRENVFKRLLIYAGNNTMTVLTWHFLCFKLVSLCIIYLYNLPIEQLACFPIIPEYKDAWWPAYFIIGTGVPLLLLYTTQFLKRKRTSQIPEL